MGMPARTRRLPGDRRIRRALVAYGLAVFADFASWLAILLVAYQQGGPTFVGGASIALLLPAIVLTPLVAGMGDRMPRGRALALAHAGVAVSAAVAGVLLAVGAPLWSVLVFGAALNVAVSLVRPMHFAAIPLLATRPGDLVAANALSSSLDGATLFVGFLVAGVLTERVGAGMVLLLCSLLALTATLLTAGMRTPVAPIDGGDVPGRIRAALFGFASLRRNPGAAVLLLLMAVMSVVEGANDTLTLTFNDQVLGLTDSTAGLLAGAFGIGLAVGGALLAGLAHRRRLAPVVLAGAVLMGLTQAAVSFVGALWPAFTFLMLVGVGVSMILVSGRTLLQRSTDDAVLGRVMGVQEGVYLVGLTVGAVVGPILVMLMGPSRAFLPLGVLVALIGVLAYPAIRAQDVHGGPRAEELALLGGVPFLAALPPYALQRLAQRARWVDVPAGAVVVAQGDPGDSYYLVARGELSVTVDGVLREHRMSPGDGFGEIALLHRVPRTATIRALVDCRLLAVSAADFLTTVTSSAQGVLIAHGIADARRRSDLPDE